MVILTMMVIKVQRQLTRGNFYRFQERVKDPCPGQQGQRECFHSRVLDATVLKECYRSQEVAARTELYQS